jgi:cytochrome P450
MMNPSSPTAGIRSAPGVPAEDFLSWPVSEATQQFPFAYYAALRRHGPVYRYPARHDGDADVFMVTGWHEIASVLIQADVFSVDLSGALPAWEDMATQPAPCPHVKSHHGPRAVFFSEGDDHKIKRAWVLMFVERERLARYRSAISEEVDKLIDEFAADGTCEIRQALTDHLPTKVLAAIVGLTREEAALVHAWSLAEAVTALNPNPTPAETAAREQAQTESGAFYLSVLEDRIAHPRDDYLSDLIALQIEQDGSFDPNALAIHLRIMMFGGDHAMGTLLADLALHLAGDADMQERLRRNPRRIPQFVRETLRVESPVPTLARKCVVDTTLGGETVRAGSVVFVALAAGNRDPSEFPDPEAIDLDRPNTQGRQLALGRGVHRCAGATLAQLEGEVTVERLLARLDDIRLDEDASDLAPEPRFCAGFRVPTAVRVRYRARP